MIKPFLFVFLFFLFAHAFSQTFQDTIPFRNNLGLIVVPIKFNGIEKQFAFDTGAERSIAYGWAKKTLKQTGKTITINSSSGLKSKMRFYNSGKIELGSRKIRGHTILNAPKNEIFACHNIDGVLGVDIIKALNWTIDYQKKIIIMYPASFFPENIQTMHQLNFDFSKNRPYVYLKLKNNTLKFLVDTGAGGASNISKRNYHLTNLDNYPKRTFYSGNFDVNGILTYSKPTIFKISEMKSNKVTLSPLIYYNNQKSTKIGNKLWKDKQLFISLKNKQLYVSDNKINQVHQSFSCTVMYYRGKMRIMRIEIGSNLWNKGVRQGDEILLFDGKYFQNFCDLDQYQRKLLQTKNTFELTLTNNEKVIISRT